MTSRAIALAILAAALAGCAAPEPADLLIVDVTIVSPERESIDVGYVRVDGERIAAVGPGRPPGSVTARRTIDGTGKFLIPGLIDSHVHLAAIPGMRYPTPPPLAAMADAYFEQLPRSYLYYGYTALIDLNVIDRGLLSRIARAPLHPEVFDCDGALTLANGYPMVYLPPDERFDACPNFLWDERQADAIPERFAREDHTPAAVVARVAEAGGICTKSHWEDGFGESIWPTPSESMMSEVVERSRAQGLTATMHANSYEAWRFAAAVGVDVIVHGMWNWDGLRAEGEGLPQPIEELLDGIVADGVGVQPTVQVMGGLQAIYRDGFLDDERLAAVLPRALLDWYASDEGRWFAEQLRAEDFDGLPDERIAAIQQRILGQGKRVLGRLARTEARLLFGTDTPSSPTYGNPPGLNGLLEMRHWVDAGVSLPTLLAAATIDNARAFGLDGDYGTIESGKLANLVLLDENPLADVAAYDTISTVVLRGRPIPRAELSARRER